MQVTSSYQPLRQEQGDWLVVGVWENEPLSPALVELDQATDGLIARLQLQNDLSGKSREIVPVYNARGIAAERLMLIGLGARAKADRASLMAVGGAAARAITGKRLHRVVIAVPDEWPGMEGDALAASLGFGFRQACEGPGLRKSHQDRFIPEELCLALPRNAFPLRQADRRIEVEGRAVSLARELVNLPPCDLYPETFVERARQVATRVGLTIDVFDEQRLADERMEALLAVARGSIRPPRFVVLRHHGARAGKTLAFVGKGVTFDSGGLSLKSNENMLDMKCDMAGAATVLAAFQAIAELNIPINAIGLLPLVENMPGGKAMKLGDVLKARNGKTIEVQNTDAEGRLILADALSYAVDQRVDHIIDLATLTGACVVALGNDVAGLMTNDEEWGQRVLAAIRSAGEKAWPLPMFSHYSEMIKSDVADIRNTGGSRYAGAITAAKFLEEFVAGIPWTHLDIAGPAFAEKETSWRDSGGTGAFVRSLVELARLYTMQG